MQIQQLFSWPATNWPAAVPATQYTIYQLSPMPVGAIQNASTTSALLTFDDSLNYVFQVRPSHGTLPTLDAVGPEVTTFVVGYVPCRAWLRQKVRMAVADRADGTASATLLFPDDELNQYIQEAFGELNVTFPVERTSQIMLLPPTIDASGNAIGTRIYPLPIDFLFMDTVEAVLQNERFHYFLKEKPWKGGESTATSYLAYPKLGILASPHQGRYYAGHFQVYENQLQIDWDPSGTGEYLNLSYEGRRLLPSDDATPFDDVTAEDMELLSLYTQMKCWLRLEGNDTRLSRWIEKKRDDMPTAKQSTGIKNLYDQRVNDRRETRPRALRLVRR